MIKRSCKLLLCGLVLALGLLSSVVGNAEEYKFFSLEVDSPHWKDISPGDYGDGIETQVLMYDDYKTFLSIDAQSTEKPLTQEEFQAFCHKILEDHYYIYGYRVISSHFDDFEAVFQLQSVAMNRELRMRHQNSVIIWFSSVGDKKEEGWALADKIRIK